MIIVSESFLENIRVRDNFIERVRAPNIGIVESFVLMNVQALENQQSSSFFFIFLSIIDIKSDRY